RSVRQPTVAAAAALAQEALDVRDQLVPRGQLRFVGHLLQLLDVGSRLLVVGGRRVEQRAGRQRLSRQLTQRQVQGQVATDVRDQLDRGGGVCGRDIVGNLGVEAEARNAGARGGELHHGDRG